MNARNLGDLYSKNVEKLDFVQNRIETCGGYKVVLGIIAKLEVDLVLSKNLGQEKP